MRYLKYAFLGALAVILFTLALANRQAVTVRIVTDEVAEVLGIPNQATVPLFLVILLALVAGILVGLVWEWFREHQYRAAATEKAREAAALKRDLRQARSEGRKEPGDDVLALLE